VRPRDEHRGVVGEVGALLATRADRQNVGAVAEGHGGVVGAGADGDAGTGCRPHRHGEAAGGSVVQEVRFFVTEDDHLGIGGERAGQPQQLAPQGVSGIRSDRAARGDVDLEQPSDRPVERVEGRVGGDFLLRLALQDVGDGEVLGRAQTMALPAKPRPMAALIW
jgi:hypothetical protein